MIPKNASVIVARIQRFMGISIMIELERHNFHKKLTSGYCSKMAVYGELLRQ
jgi:hypothetical protein